MALWGGWLIYASIRREHLRFAGHNLARCGLIASMLVIVMIATFIGVTVPERLRQRERGIQAGIEAQGYTMQRALLEYRELYKTYPTNFKDLQDGLSDRDGSIAAALSNIDPSTYQPRANLANASAAKPGRLRGAACAAPLGIIHRRFGNEKISFTNYEVRLPAKIRFEHRTTG